MKKLTHHLIFTVMLIFIFNFVFSMLSCNTNSGGTSTGNPLINLRSGTYSGLSALSVNEVRFCFKRVRFKLPGELTNSDPALDADNIDFAIGEKILNTLGDNFGSINVPPGNYARIEFDLANTCGNGYSAYVVNSSGTFSTTQGATIKFSGNITINADISIELMLQNLIFSLNSVTNNADIKTNLEAASGVF